MSLQGWSAHDFFLHMIRCCQHQVGHKTTFKRSGIWRMDWKCCRTVALLAARNGYLRQKLLCVDIYFQELQNKLFTASVWNGFSKSGSNDGLKSNIKTDKWGFNLSLSPHGASKGLLTFSADEKCEGRGRGKRKTMDPTMCCAQLSADCQLSSDSHNNCSHNLGRPFSI